MIPEEFKYNHSASYRRGAKYKEKKIELTKQTIYVNENDHFPVSFPDLFQKYQNPSLHSNEPWYTWLNSSFDWWQCQLNFAVWCATAGCGVSYQDHLQNTSGLTKTVYIFHVYYCISRILKELKTPLPTDTSYCYYKNPYDKAAYQKLCNEFNVPPSADWRQKLEPSNKCSGLGEFSTYYKPDGNYRQAHRSEGPFFSPIDEIAHTRDISEAWTMFILDKSQGFTKAGVERINESIRMFVWALLGAQSQTRVEILKLGTGFDAQKQFLSNIQDAINSPIDLPTQIDKYQNVLKYARSKVDFTYGLGLYMSPSDMVLQIGTIEGYNNKIVIATENQTLGVNDDVNTKPVSPATQPATINGTPTKKSTPEPKTNTLTKREYKERVKQYANIHNLPQSWVNRIGDEYPDGIENWLIARVKEQYPDEAPDVHPPTKKTVDVHPATKPDKKDDHHITVITTDEHENNKTALIVGSIALGSIILVMCK